jgi:hypothetical protein
MDYQEFSDYRGPTGPYVATGKEIVPLGTVGGIVAATQSVMLASLGPNPEARQYAHAMKDSLARAYEADKSFLFVTNL